MSGTLNLIIGRADTGKTARVIVFATGPAAEMRQALGTAVFAGMLGVTVIGLFLTPVFYVVLRKLVAGRRKPEAETAPVETA